jgi:hypothetical protein
MGEMKDRGIQREETIMSRSTDTNSKNPIDKTVRRLDDFPELLHALRDGDLLTCRLFCAQLFDCDRWRNRLSETTVSQAAMKAN